MAKIKPESTVPQVASSVLDQILDVLAERIAARLAERAEPTPPRAESTPPPVWLTPQQAAGRLGVAVRTLEAWRGEGRGPTFAKIGRSIRYGVDAIDAWASGSKK